MFGAIDSLVHPSSHTVEVTQTHGGDVLPYPFSLEEQTSLSNFWEFSVPLPSGNAQCSLSFHYPFMGGLAALLKPMTHFLNTFLSVFPLSNDYQSSRKLSS